MPEREPTRVVFDVNIYISAVHDRSKPRLPSDFRLPPIERNPGLVALSVVRQGLLDGRFPCALFYSKHVLVNVVHVLRRTIGWSDEDVGDYFRLIRDLAESSGGGKVNPSSIIKECPDLEDDNILALAYDAKARVIVSNDHDLTDMSPWRGILILPADRFWMYALDARHKGR